MGLNFIIKLKVYPFDVMISVDETDDELLKILKEYSNTKKECKPLFNMSDTTHGRSYMLPSNQTVIRLKIKEDLYYTKGVICHEVFHAVTAILNRIGMPLEPNINEEAYAYLTGYLCETIFKKLKL